MRCILVPRIRRRTTQAAREYLEADLNRLVLKRKRAKADNDLNSGRDDRDSQAAGAIQMDFATSCVFFFLG